MRIDAGLAAIANEASAWRRDFHEHPEILYDVVRTGGLVSERLRGFGCDDVIEGVGKTGVVGVIHGRCGPGGRVIALRADMDALLIEEETNLPHRSKSVGRMHACGHDGHIAMLLGAAKYLAAARDFDGTVIVVFQPAEEGGAGGKAMVDDGLMDRWKIEEVFGLHNLPGMPEGHIGFRDGVIMAAADRFTIEIEGKGSHAAEPHRGIDTILIGSHLVVVLQSIVSRNADPLKAVVVSTTSFQAGATFNVIPQRATLQGTVRTLDPDMRTLAESRLGEITAATARIFGGDARLHYERCYPATVNHPDQTRYAAEAARRSVGEDKCLPNVAPMMGGEDFAFMLEARPGAYVFIGNGDTAALHHPSYDFNDKILPAGIAFWVELARTRATRVKP